MKLFEAKMFGRSWVGTDDAQRTRTPGRIEKFYGSLVGAERELFRRVCANLPDPKEFMREFAPVFGWDAEMVEKARVFTPRPLPNPVEYFPWSWHCYDNCLRRAREEGLLYVEGLVIGPGGPTIHAWNSTDGFNVIDLGWPCQHLNKYMGFIFDLKQHKELIGFLGELFERAKRAL